MDVVAAIPAAATGVLTMWTQDFEPRRAAGFSNIPTVPVAHFNVVGSPPAVYTIAERHAAARIDSGARQSRRSAPATATLLDPAAFVPAKPGLPSQDIQLTNSGEPARRQRLIQGHHDFPGAYTAVPHEGSARYAEARRHARAHRHERDQRAPSVPPARVLDPADRAHEARRRRRSTFPVHASSGTTSTSPPVHAALQGPDRRSAVDGRHDARRRTRPMGLPLPHLLPRRVRHDFASSSSRDADGKERPYVNANDTLIEALAGQNVHDARHLRRTRTARR